MTLRILDADLPQKFAEMEGLSPEALSRELKSDHPDSLGYAIRNFERERAEYIQSQLWMGETEDTIDLSDSLGGTIYGAGGYHRYIVRVSGEVCFSKFHAAWPKDENIAKAEEHGFDLW